MAFSEAPLVEYRPALLYCLNPFVYESKVNFYREEIKNNRDFSPILIFQIYHVDWRLYLPVVLDGTHRAKASLFERVAVKAVITEPPPRYFDIYPLKSIPQIKGDETWAVLPLRKTKN